MDVDVDMDVEVDMHVDVDMDIYVSCVCAYCIKSNVCARHATRRTGRRQQPAH